jgi:hypothetical protein
VIHALHISLNTVSIMKLAHSSFQKEIETK